MASDMVSRGMRASMTRASTMIYCAVQGSAPHRAGLIQWTRSHTLLQQAENGRRTDRREESCSCQSDKGEPDACISREVNYASGLCDVYEAPRRSETRGGHAPPNHVAKLLVSPADIVGQEKFCQWRDREEVEEWVLQVAEAEAASNVSEARSRCSTANMEKQ